MSFVEMTDRYIEELEKSGDLGLAIWKAFGFKKDEEKDNELH